MQNNDVCGIDRSTSCNPENSLYGEAMLDAGTIEWYKNHGGLVYVDLLEKTVEYQYCDRNAIPADMMKKIFAECGFTI
jgi:hypothetical protein